ncbi:hypothetical protein LOD99_1976 [Oopsacas minuta]|uniref:Uncharacterized protein n=1 Tax=Oopsacas minuta TaxID=111878 RepID=A0AAV7K2K5_9METZ|nr:hypothetical protein LOD99_1976 [Oopsacas minuta]
MIPVKISGDNYHDWYQGCREKDFYMTSVAALEDATDLKQKTPRNLINFNLLTEQKTALTDLLHTFEHVFAQNLKHSLLAKGVTHCIDTGSLPPCKQRLIPVAPGVEEEISKAVEECTITIYAGGLTLLGQVVFLHPLLHPYG